jgi:hypothetical protein
MQSPLSRILCRGQTTTGDPRVVVSWFGVAWTPSMTPQTKAQGGSLRSNCRDCDCMRHNARADYCTFGFRRPLAEHSSAGLRSSDDRIVHVARHGVWIRGYALRNYWERVVFVCAWRLVARVHVFDIPYYLAYIYIVRETILHFQQSTKKRRQRHTLHL